MYSRVYLLIITILCVQLVNAERPITASIRISAQTQNGEVLQSPSIHFVAVGSKQDLGPQFKDGAIKSVPLGYYDLLVSVPGFREYRRRMGIFSQTFAVRATMQVS